MSLARRQLASAGADALPAPTGATLVDVPSRALSPAGDDQPHPRLGYGDMHKSSPTVQNCMSPAERSLLRWPIRLARAGAPVIGADQAGLRAPAEHQQPRELARREGERSHGSGQATEDVRHI